MIRDLPSEPLATGGSENGALSGSSSDPPKQPLFRLPGLSLPRAAWGTASLFAAAASMLAAPGWGGALGAGLAVAMIAIAAVDAREFIIPDKLVLAGVLLGLADAALADPDHAAAGLANAALRAFVLAFIFFVFRAAYCHLRDRQGLGLGDVKLAAVAGAWLGWVAAGLAVDIAALLALVGVVIRPRGERISGTTRIPFGLFFAPAIWAVWLISSLGLPIPF
jgi:leader peptidase (prepilin peptidase) / N-methyltransferase